MSGGDFFECPRKGEIHLFHVETEGNFEALSNSEKIRYNSYETGSVAKMFLKSRSALRTLISKYTGKTPQELEFGVMENGKPYLISSRGLQFNMSHSGEALSLAFSSEPVGLDLENKTRKGNFLEVARRYFRDEETRRVEAGGAAAFLEIWTAKEAILKLAGKGIAGGLEQAFVSETGEGFLESRRIFLQRFARGNSIGTLASYSEIFSVREAVY